MKTTVASISAALLLSGVLAGCGTSNNNAANHPHKTPNNGTRSINYHNGNGPTDNALRNHYGNRSGYNRMNVNNNRDRNMGYSDTHNTTHARAHKREAQKMADKVSNLKNVENASVVVTDNDVVVGVKTNDHGTTRHFKSKIRTTVQNEAGHKNVHVTTDPAMYKRIHKTSTNLRSGARHGVREVNSDVRGIINDLGKAAKRPFERNTH